MFHFKRAIRDIRQNRFLNIVTTVTIAMSILVVSAFALLFMNVNALMNAWKNNVRIMAYLMPGTPTDEISALKKDLQEIYGIQAVRFISKQAALIQMKSQLRHQSSLLDDLRENPLPDAFELQLGSTLKHWERIEKIADQVGLLPKVAEVEYGQQWLGRFVYVYHMFRIAGYAFGILFFMAAVFFVANTIRLVIYSRRDEVEIMRLVGASDRFIKIPFYFIGIIQGAVGGILGLVALLIVFSLISTNIEQSFFADFYQIQFLQFNIMLAILAGSGFVGWLGSYISLKQFLKQ